MDSKDLHNLSEVWNNITLSEEYLSEGQALNILEELGPEGYQELLECVEYLYERSLTSSDLQVIQQAQAARQKAAEQQSRTAPTGIGSDPRSGALGQLIRTIQKTGITGPAGRQAALDYDAAIAALRKIIPTLNQGLWNRTLLLPHKFVSKCSLSVISEQDLIQDLIMEVVQDLQRQC